MFVNMRNRLLTAIVPDNRSMLPPLPSLHGDDGHEPYAKRCLIDKFNYARPVFLQLLTPDELKASADHNVRPIIVPRDISILPFGTGYAECVNSGKSEWNEDQAAFCRQVLSDPSKKHPDLPYTYFGIFDGHAGYGAALAASHQFHLILHEKLVDIIDMLLPRGEDENGAVHPQGLPHPRHFYKTVTKDELVVGALESAFFNMDALIAQDRLWYRDAGGCTALVTLFIYGKMFVANAGDSRGVLCQRATPKVLNGGAENDEDTKQVFPVPFSFDHTPETERRRLMNTAQLKPQLIGRQYIAMEYARRPHVRDLGQRILCRQGNTEGWVYKTITREDLRMPVVTGEGKRSRLLGTLGVTRGFGDHDLLAMNTGTLIKPFLTPHPEVKCRDLSKIVSIPGENNEDGDYGILVMATDGLWDVSENDVVAKTVFQTLAMYPTEKHRYTMVAQELVAKARGKINEYGHWRLADSKAAATVDDISVIVIPVYQYYKEHAEWERICAEKTKQQEQEQLQAQAQEVVVVTNGVVEEDVSAAASALEAIEIHSNNDDEDYDAEKQENEQKQKQKQKEDLTSPEVKAA
ncbi:protein phosphatase 1H [Eupeodes corollae]|uniref:protein phosphatase 1H n=1 Tax=Eupeodes corollae TaxID=290404 RepID=UPI002490A1EA|nr:protein phosphatase 1H [Eupeodes corollae]XP_055913758.1 protein phosphatase 1H [Eupeodes corollae]